MFGSFFLIFLYFSVNLFAGVNCDCTTAKNCGDCVRDLVHGDCSWCAQTSTCHDRYLNESCSVPLYYSPEQCSCETYDCSTCSTTAENCAWCDDRCIPLMDAESCVYHSEGDCISDPEFFFGSSGFWIVSIGTVFLVVASVLRCLYKRHYRHKYRHLQFEEAFGETQNDPLMTTESFD